MSISRLTEYMRLEDGDRFIILCYGSINDDCNDKRSVLGNTEIWQKIREGERNGCCTY